MELNLSSCSVKAVDTLRIALPTVPNSSRTATTLVSTISSDGKVQLYDLASVPAQSTSKDVQPQNSPVADYDTKGSRLTCLTLADGDVGGPAVANGKRKRDADDDEKDVEDEGSEEWDSQEEEEGEEEDEEDGEDEDEDEEDE